jgi:hypothetical protein
MSAATVAKKARATKKTTATVTSAPKKRPATKTSTTATAAALPVTLTAKPRVPGLRLPKPKALPATDAFNLEQYALGLAIVRMALRQLGTAARGAQAQAGAGAKLQALERLLRLAADLQYRAVFGDPKAALGGSAWASMAAPLVFDMTDDPAGDGAGNGATEYGGA